MIVIQDLREGTAKKMESKLKGVFSCTSDAGAPNCVRARLDDEATIFHKAHGTHVIVTYGASQYLLPVSDFATMEIL